MKDNKKSYIISVLIIVAIIAGIYYFNKKSPTTPSSEYPEGSVTSASFPLGNGAEASQTNTASSSSNDNSTSNSLKISGVGMAVLGDVSVSAKTFGDNDTIGIGFKGTGLLGPVYLYLQNTVTRQIVAAKLLSETEFYKKGETSGVMFNLQNTKASSLILSGTYQVVICDVGKGINQSLCAASVPITIVDSDVSLTYTSPDVIFSGSEVTLYGTGFDSNTLLVIDGKERKDIKTTFISATTLRFTLPSSIMWGKHTIQVKDTKNIGSNTLQLDVFGR